MMQSRLVLASLVAVFVATGCRTPRPGSSSVKEGEGEAQPLMFIEKENVFAPEKCAGPGCWTNYLRVTDLDADGDLDVVHVNYADFFGGGAKKQPLVVSLNDGKANFTDGSSMFGNYTAELRQVAIADVNGDGFPDLYAPNAVGKADAFFVSNGEGGFADEAATRVGGRKSSAGAVRFVDVDSDGDLDLFVAKGYAKGKIGANIGDVLLNDGSGKFAVAEGAVTGTALGNDIDDVDVIDIDNDFDPDLVVNPHNGGNVFFLKNDGTGKFAVDAAAVGAAPGSGNHYDPAVCDFNADGFNDVFLDNIGGGYNELLLMNDKTGKFVNATENVKGNDDGQDDNGVVCADVNNDGAMDAIVISLFDAGERLFLNDGAGILTYRMGAFKMFQDGTLWGEFGDLDGDKKIDFVTAQGESGATMQNRVYLANDLVPADDRAPTIRAVEALKAGRIRFGVSDRTITDEAPQLTAAFARARVDGAVKEIKATYMGGDLFRVALPATGVSQYSVCARDLFGNEACSPEQVATP